MSPPAIRLVVSDVDGTLLQPDRTLAPSTLAAVERLRAAGVKLALVSSRPPRGFDWVAAQLGLDTPRAGFNGGVIEDADRTILQQHTIQADATRDAITLLEGAGVDVWMFARGVWLLKNPDAAYVPVERSAIRMDWQEVDDFSPYLGEAHKLMGSSADHARLGEMEAALQARIGTQAAVHRSQAYYLDVTDAQANKGTALHALARLIGVDVAQTAALGDMENDVPMLAAAGFGIAMGNAPDGVKAGAAAITARNDDDGWAAAIDRFVLPRR